MTNKRETGARYEQLAAEYLESMGHCILERNFRCRQGEIDLISQDGNYLVFTEVKYRASSRYGEPLEAVTPKKQHIISKVASYYCMKMHKNDSTPCRFDVIAVEGEKITHIPNAFEYR